MSERELQGSLINSQLIASLAARAALETPGVLRLEPTIRGLLSRLGPAARRSFHRTVSQDGSYRLDGVTATIADGAAVVRLDIATDIAYTALTVAESVQQRVQETIQHTGLAPSQVHIHVLAIEPWSDATRK